MNGYFDIVGDHPRPQLYRQSYASLNGTWDFCFDEKNEGERRGFHKGFEREYEIVVPYTYECKASGIGREEPVENVWYKRKFSLEKGQRGGRVLLHFDGVDYRCKAWVNGQFVGSHEGGYARFSFDVTNVVRTGENLLVVKAEDSMDLEIPRGKQRFRPQSDYCWYVQTTGIWKDVWLEFVPDTYLSYLNFTARDKRGAVMYYELGGAASSRELEGMEIGVTVYRRGREVCSLKSTVLYPRDKLDVRLYHDMHQELDGWWNADEQPPLFECRIVLFKNGKTVDEAYSYFGIRTVSVEHGSVCVNGNPVYQKLLLYQGYWKDTGLTPPSWKAAVEDLKTIKKMGFNGIRVHQKIEEDRFLFWADRLGLYVWYESPCAQLFGPASLDALSSQWKEMVKQGACHPSVIAYVLFNESWGVREMNCEAAVRNFVDAMVLLTKAMDGSRLVISNDGWEHTRSDILTVHNYEQDAERLEKFYLEPSHAAGPARPLFINGYKDEGQPVLLSEFGGGFTQPRGGMCVYGVYENGEKLLEEYRALLSAIARLPFNGFCYTQYSDVQQEKNGFVREDRTYKLDLEKIAEANAEFDRNLFRLGKTVP